MPKKTRSALQIELDSMNTHKKCRKKNRTAHSNLDLKKNQLTLPNIKYLSPALLEEAQKGTK